MSTCLREMLHVRKMSLQQTIKLKKEKFNLQLLWMLLLLWMLWMLWLLWMLPRYLDVSQIANTRHALRLSEREQSKGFLNGFNVCI